MSKIALVTGISGQDGSYLAEFLLAKGYEVHGMMRRTSTKSSGRIDHLKDKFTLHEGDLLDSTSLTRMLDQVRPDEVYNLAAQSFVPVSWEQPIFTSEVTGLGVTRMLDAVLHVDKSTRFYQASSSEMFGKVRESPQSEETPFYPRSPYGVAKAYGHHITVNYRESYGMFACSGILFNHESPRRGLEFVTRKIANAVARIKLGLDEELRLGNLDAKRDWGHAREYARGMWLMLQQRRPDDYVLATGKTTQVREFVVRAFSEAGITLEFAGEGVEEQGVDAKTGAVLVEVDPRYYRPTEVDMLIGDASKAHRVLGWRHEISWEELCAEMVREDLIAVGKEQRRNAD
jgi:GDPmannose 4,6-dehydratase